MSESIRPEERKDTVLMRDGYTEALLNRVALLENRLLQNPTPGQLKHMAERLHRVECLYEAVLSRNKILKRMVDEQKKLTACKVLERESARDASTSGP